MKVRPSELYGIHDELAAYCFDRAVVAFGSSVEADIKEEAEDAKDKSQAKRKAQMRLNTWLRDDTEVAATTQRFRDPMDQIKKQASVAPKKKAVHPAFGGGE